MIKNLCLFAFSAILGITLLISCEKDSKVTSEVVQYDGFSLIDGRLAFDSEESFNKVLDMHYLNQDGLDAWEKSISEYVSMRTQFESYSDENAEELKDNIEDYKYLFAMLEEENGDFSIERNLYNDVLSTVINSNGFLQIGNDVHRFTYAQFYTTDVSNIELLKSEAYQNSEVKTTEIKREFEISDQSDQIMQRAYTVGQCVQQDGPRRVIGQIVREEIFGSDCNIITKHQRRRFGIWWSNRTNISVSFSGNFVKIHGNCLFGPYPFFNGFGSSNNSSRITRTVPANHSSWNGCTSGEVTPYHNGAYSSSHNAGGKQCSLSCPAGSPCG